jgi:hypothetical protein
VSIVACVVHSTQVTETLQKRGIELTAAMDMFSMESAISGAAGAFTCGQPVPAAGQPGPPLAE